MPEKDLRTLLPALTPTPGLDLLIVSGNRFDNCFMDSTAMQVKAITY